MRSGFFFDVEIGGVRNDDAVGVDLHSRLDAEHEAREVLVALINDAEKGDHPQSIHVSVREHPGTPFFEVSFRSARLAAGE